MIIALLYNNQAILSKEFFSDGRQIILTLQFQNGENWADIEVSLRHKSVSMFTPTNLYLFHVSCLRLLESKTQKTVTAVQLFCLCQSLQPELNRNFRIRETNLVKSKLKFDTIENVGLY